MKKILLPLASLFLFNNANAQWATQTPPNPSNNLYSVWALSPNNVAAAGFTGVIRSLNAGASWSQPISLGGVNMYEVHSANPNKWYALCQNNSWFIKMSTGSTTLQGGKPDSILSLNCSANMACIIAVGTAGKIETTCDTGATWTVRNSGSTSNLNAVWYSDADSITAVGNLGIIRRSTDAGMTWSVVTSGTSFHLNGIHFPTPSIGYIVGNNGVFLKSTNAGRTWTSIPTGTNTNYNGVYFVDKDTGYVVGAGGVIMKTINGGTGWMYHTSPTTQILNSIHFVTPVDGWIVGNAGTILKYTGVFTTNVQPIVAPIVAATLYPNPAADHLTIRSAKDISLKVLNALGQKIDEITMTETEMKLNVSNYVKGVYFIEFSNGENTSVQKFVKE